MTNNNQKFEIHEEKCMLCGLQIEPDTGFCKIHYELLTETDKLHVIRIKEDLKQHHKKQNHNHSWIWGIFLFVIFFFRLFFIFIIPLFMIIILVNLADMSVEEKYHQIRYQLYLEFLLISQKYSPTQSITPNSTTFKAQDPIVQPESTPIQRIDDQSIQLSNRSQAKYCVYCGSLRPPEARFCGSCGLLFD